MSKLRSEVARQRIILSFLLSMALLITSTPSSQAIFGFSKCEKVKKKIAQEEKVGLEFHKSYKQHMTQFRSLLNPTRKDLVDVLTSLKDVYDSDTRVYKIIGLNMSCFSAKQIARARTSENQRKSDLGTIVELQISLKKDPNSFTLPLPKGAQSDFSTLYLSYYSFLENKKLD